jgi:HPt (histidine-containing phosphotransfer) domain-containing protein
MTRHFQGIEWMPSPPLAPDIGSIDLVHLNRMTLGDIALEHEVLSIFSEQSARLLGQIAALPEDVRALTHTLKGSARAIGAFGVADVAERLEAALAGGGQPVELIAELGNAVALARTTIDAMLHAS